MIFDELVKSYINVGWQPLGPASFVISNTGVWQQTMVKYKEAV